MPKAARRSAKNPQTKDNHITSKVILISGVTRGLGWAMTDEFIRLGLRVLGCSLSREAIQGLNQKHGPDNRFEVVGVM
jgi:NAD(P)-dependent dehydrogenase (short-subunit alcohol dehydrogenase family)